MEVLTAQEVCIPEYLDPRDYDELHQVFKYAEQNRDLLESLDPALRSAVAEMALKHLYGDEYIQLKKLFKNAVVYVAEGRVTRADEGGFDITGLTDSHHLDVSEEGHWNCDCDLFNGRGKFEGRAGECSHIQTATLYMLAESMTTETGIDCDQ